MRKTVVVHVGTHKTGTTAIQRFCHVNRSELAARGVLYPSSCAYHYAQHRLAFALRGTRPPGEKDKPDCETEARALVDEMARSSCPTVFLSSEEFFTLPAAAIARLAGILEGLEVRILAVLRRPDALFASIYNQMVKEPRNRFSRPHKAFVDQPHRLSPVLDFRSALDTWSEVFGHASVHVKCIEQYPDALALAASVVGWDSRGLAAEHQRANVSVSIRTAELIRLGKQGGLVEPQLRRLLVLGEQHFGSAKEAESLLTPGERMHILRSADTATDHVFRRFVGGENLYASSRFDEGQFPAATQLSKLDIMKVVGSLLPRAETTKAGPRR